jgi:hypothetical protein
VVLADKERDVDKLDVIKDPLVAASYQRILFPPLEGTALNVAVEYWQTVEPVTEFTDGVVKTVTVAEPLEAFVPLQLVAET